MREKLTKRTADAASANAKNATRDVFVWDTELKGFGFKITPKGKRVFVVQYLAPGLHRVTRRKTLGAYGALTVEDARDKAKNVLARVLSGGDPAKEQADQRKAARDETVEKLLEQYLDDGIGRRKPRTLEFYESLARLYIVPALGRLPVAKVTARHVADLHRDLRDKPVTANRVVRLVRSFFYWLAKRDLVSDKNPAKDTDWYPEQERERYLTIEEMARLGQALRVAETIGLPPAPQHRRAPSTKRARNAGMFVSDIQPANPVAVACLRFLMFTGWRESEARTLEWSAINLNNATVTLPDTKTGKSVRTLPAPACELLAAQPRVKDSPFVFPGRDPMQPIRELQRVWYAARSEARIENVRLHDLRHSVASWAGGRGYSLFLIGKLLGHRDQRSTARYAHLAEDIRKTMADDVGEVIREAMESDYETRGHVAKLRKLS